MKNLILITLLGLLFTISTSAQMEDFQSATDCPNVSVACGVALDFGECLDSWYPSHGTPTIGGSNNNSPNKSLGMHFKPHVVDAFNPNFQSESAFSTKFSFQEGNCYVLKFKALLSDATADDTDEDVFPLLFEIRLASNLVPDQQFCLGYTTNTSPVQTVFSKNVQDVPDFFKEYVVIFEADQDFDQLWVDVNTNIEPGFYPLWQQEPGYIFVDDIKVEEVDCTYPCQPLCDEVIQGEDINISSLGFTSNEIIDKCLAFSGTIVIDQDTKLYNCKIAMQPGAEIVVKPGVELECYDSEISGCCAPMWKGINVESEGVIRFRKNTITDAQYAIKTNLGSKFLIQENVFDRNYIGVYFEGVNTQLGAFIENTFSCTSNLTGPYEGQLPEPELKGLAGVFLQSAQGVSIGSKILVNPPSRNYFYDSYNGILAYGSTFSVNAADMEINQSEQNTSVPPSLDYFYGMKGNGIRAYRSLLLVRNSNLKSFSRGMVIDNCYFKAQNNTLGSLNDGGVGFFIRNLQQNIVEIKDNYLQNVSMGIEMKMSVGKIQIESNQISLNQNEITDGWDTYTGILANKVGSTEGDVQIYNNIINTQGWFRGGIHLLNSSNINVENNDILINHNNLVNGGGKGVYVEGGNKNRIRDNTVSENNYVENLVSPRTGIYVSNSTNTLVCCNNLDKTKIGIQFVGDCSMSTIGNNQLNTHAQGLRYEIGAITEEQLYTGNEWNMACFNSDAIHLGGDLQAMMSNYKVDESQAPFDNNYMSALITSLDGGEVQTCVTEPICGQEDWSWKAPQEQLISAVLDENYSSFENGNLLRWNWERSLYKNAENVSNSEELSQFIEIFEESENSNLSNHEVWIQNSYFQSNNEANEIGLELEVMLEGIQEDLDDELSGEDIELYLSNQTILSDLYSEWTQVQSTGTQNILLSATSLRDNLISLEVNGELANTEKNLYVIFYELLLGNTLSQKDAKFLLETGNSCELEYGKLVYMARSLYQRINDEEVVWIDNCDKYEQVKKASNSSTINSVTGVNIYPNPSEGIVNIRCSGELNDFQMIQIFNVQGVLIDTFDNPSFNIQIALDKGLYFIKISIDNQNVIKKIIIN